jgi:hypothetical protein
MEENENEGKWDKKPSTFFFRFKLDLSKLENLRFEVS